MAMRPFQGDTSEGIGGLTVEGSPDKVSVYGSLDIRMDLAGLDAARRLERIAGAAVRALESRELPERAREAPGVSGTEANPLA